MISLVRAGVLLTLVLATAQHARAADQVIGLLSLPEVFGNGACDKFTPAQVPLYSSPDAGRVVGTIRVNRHWTFHLLGGCEGLKVSVHREGSGQLSELPTREYEYEVPAAIVLQQRAPWFRVRLHDGTAWLRASKLDRFFPLRRLLTDGLTYLTEEWDGRLAASPGSIRRAARRGILHADRQVTAARVAGFRLVGHQLWVDVEVLSESRCTSADEPKVVARGWLPAHASSGEPAVWFSSRGC